MAGRFGDFSEALASLLGPHAKGLSAKTITRLKADWWKDYEAWQKLDLGTRRFLYVWADGVYFKPRMAEKNNVFWWSWVPMDMVTRNFWP